MACKLSWSCSIFVSEWIMQYKWRWQNLRLKIAFILVMN
jgi:hypothetical protein